MGRGVPAGGQEGHGGDGTFYYQPNRDNNPQDYAANPRLAATAVTALILTAKHKQLQIAGAKLTGDLDASPAPKNPRR